MDKSRSRLLRAVALTATLAAVIGLAWAAILAVTGGFNFRLLGASLSSHDPWRPLSAACLAGAVGLAASRRLGWLAVDWERERARAFWPRAAVATAICVLGLLVAQRSAFVAAGADASGYISQSRLWASGDALRIDQPLSHDAPWPGAEWTLSPLGYRPATVAGRIVPTYPAGLPLLMAAARVLAGEAGVYCVVPLLGAVAVWLTFRLTAAMAGPLEGVAAAWLLVLSPTFLHQITQPMSDVPAMACWLAALSISWFSSGVGGAVAAGLASGVALMVRPNLLPMVGPVALALAAARPQWRDVRRRTPAYLCAVVPAGCWIAVLNSYLYGSPFASGYGSLDSLFGWSNVPGNAVSYSTWLIDSETPLLALGLLGPLVIGRTWQLHPKNPRYLSAAAIGFVAVNVAAYLPYFQYQEWWFLRFLLPSLALAYAMLCATVGAISDRIDSRVRMASVVALAVVVGAGAVRAWPRLDVFGPHRVTARFLMAAEYVSRNTPERAVIVCMEHSGSISYYTGRTILRFDQMQPEWLDRSVDHLQQQGRPVFFLLDESEMDTFTSRFIGRSRFDRLLWKPMQVLRGSDTVLMFAATGAPR